MTVAADRRLPMKSSKPRRTVRIVTYLTHDEAAALRSLRGDETESNMVRAIVREYLASVGALHG
jgi:hypothetical protein